MQLARLGNKVALVTGAADGIGLAISQAFAYHGARVVMADINLTKCQKESAKLNQKNAETLALECDVADTDQINRAITETISCFKKLDILVNNAAIAVSGNIVDMQEQDWQDILNINLGSVFRGVKAALPYLLHQDTASVINLSSVQAIRSWDNWTAYAAAKGAINSMTKQLAGQFGKNNVRFNTISPGAILTPLNEQRIAKEGPEFTKNSEQQAAMNRFGTAQEVADVAVFLASDESTFVTGEDIKVDGGLASLPRYHSSNQSDF